MTALGNLADLGLSRVPRRVVSLVPSLTESLFQLGCGDRLAAITDYCVHPAGLVSALPRVGGTKNPDPARIRSALPDLIIASREENQRETVEALQADGFPVWVTFPTTVAGVLELLWALVRVFDVPHMAPTVDALERACEVAALAAENSPLAPVFCPIWREPRAPEPPRWWMTFNHATYLHDVLRLCGGLNVFADRERRYPLAADLGEAPADPPGPDRDTRYPRVTPAEVAARAPEVILLPSEPYPFGEADGAAFDAWPALPAVREGRLRFVDGSLLTWPRTRLGRALNELPGLFAELSAPTREP
jgi:ABC-type Fe3+-hydroxamate transport system substrate-binding protein